MKNQVHLIAYVDRLGGGRIADLHHLLQGSLEGLFAGVHLLPFFHPIDGADAGFDPIDHSQVDPRLGSWSDIKALGQDMDVMADLIVNHVSSESPQFLDYSAKGADSQFSGMFLTFNRVFAGGATEQDLLKIYRPRPGLPFTQLSLRNGHRHLFWTTFTNRQIDIDVRHPQGERYLKSILRTFQTNGISAIRLDAAGYAIKKAGTSCFMLPETFDFIGELSGFAKSLGIEVLVEIHAHYRRQIEIAGLVDRVYDFALPPLVLHAIFTRTARVIKHWLRIRPQNVITVLDTHDGIGVIDIGPDQAAPAEHPGLVPDEEMDALVETIHTNTGGQSRRATGAAASNLDLYQVNSTYYDALGRSDRDYLTARAIQFFSPGIPQVYYIGLLAGENDMELLVRSNTGRDINRHYYSRHEVEEALSRPVVRALLRLIRFRNQHPAFRGEFTLGETEDELLQLRWDWGDEWAQLSVDFRHGYKAITFREGGEMKQLDLFA